MAKVNFIIYSRKSSKSGKYPLYLTIRHAGVTAPVNLGIMVTPEQWTGERIAETHPQQRTLNSALCKYRGEAETLIQDAERGYCELSAKAIAARLEEKLFPERVKDKMARTTDGICATIERFAALKQPSTRLTYERTLKHVRSFIGAGDISFNAIKRSWLMEFDTYMSQFAPSPNARAIHMRNLRAVFNFAIDEELTANYPFRKFKIKTVKTAKRNLPVEDLRRLFAMDVDEWQRPYRDFFMLSFFLIGTNPKDLLYLRRSDYSNGRITFNRSKTKRLYDIKVEPEAAALIEKYRGEEHLLSVMDTRTDYLQYIRYCNHGLQTIGMQTACGKKTTGTPDFPGITLYWARHSWATIARSIGISIDDIALALGHGDGHDLTRIYLNEDMRRVDEANRKVIDYVLRV